VIDTALPFMVGAISELALFAAVGFLIIAVDDLVVDIIFAAHRLKQLVKGRLAPDRHKPQTSTGDMLAVFIPAWQEAAVITKMLNHAARAWDARHYQIFVGCYPNDLETIAAVTSIASNVVHIALNPHPGPTTKGDCLNQVWRAMCAQEKEDGRAFSAVVLHDAEDMAHPEELHLYRRLLKNHAAVQIPVLPIIDRKNHWVSGHYADEFAEAHARDMVVRQAIGASLPFAGVGCAIRRDAMARLAVARGGLPFDAASLTEDYEMGLRLGDMGFQTAFVRQREEWGYIPIGVHAHFPNSVETAIRQKTRWTLGIALLGWQRLGWRGGLAEFWMRCRDRRAVMSALLIAIATFSLVFALALIGVAHLLDVPLPPLNTTLGVLFLINLGFVLWRAAVRFVTVNRHYGRRQAFLSLPRMAVASFIAVAASFRAVKLYLAYLNGQPLAWDKTEHVFPVHGG
jgi:bacteriophage N4 adsorption protein B